MTVAVKPLQVKTQDGKHTAGIIYGGHIFRKQLTMSNMLQSPRGWSISTNLLIDGRPVTFDELPRYGVDVIQIHVVDAPVMENLYYASYNSFKENGLDVDRKTGIHKALALPFWKTTRYYRI
jgi:hypothetical protein